MKYIEDFRNTLIAKVLAEKIKRAVDPNRHYKFMEFCGGHTHAIHRYGLPSLLPSNIEMVHGPGCPVCILPIPRINQAIALAQLPDVIFCSYGDMLRVPGSDLVKVPTNTVLLFNDNRNYEGLDSLQLGPIPEKNIKGKVLYILWSYDFKRIGLKLDARLH